MSLIDWQEEDEDDWDDWDDESDSERLVLCHVEGLWLGLTEFCRRSHAEEDDIYRLLRCFSVVHKDQWDKVTQALPAVMVPLLREAIGAT